MRVLALIFPIERHVGHWACSSSRLNIKRIIMSGKSNHEEIVNSINEFNPDAIAVCGKAAIDYLDLLDNIEPICPPLKEIPRIFRMQNSSLVQQSKETANSKDLCQRLSFWFSVACDPRWSWVFTQTLNDVDIIRKHLYPIPVSECPYGYDTLIFNPDLPDLEKKVDVGCYMNLRDDPGRKELVRKTAQICNKKGWSFNFVEGVYWHEYAKQIRETKICLHLSIHREVPFRMYETMVFGTVFLTDTLEAKVEKLFLENHEYVTYKRDFSNLEQVLEKLLSNETLRLSIGQNGRTRTLKYTWPEIADKYVAPALEKLLKKKTTNH